MVHEIEGSKAELKIPLTGQTNIPQQGEIRIEISRTMQIRELEDSILAERRHSEASAIDVLLGFEVGGWVADQLRLQADIGCADPV